MGDFDYSLSLRAAPEPYTLGLRRPLSAQLLRARTNSDVIPACRGLAKVSSGLHSSTTSLVQTGLADLTDALDLVRTFADAQLDDVATRRHTSGAPVVPLAEDGLSPQAFSCFFLRGMAFFAK